MNIKRYEIISHASIPHKLSTILHLPISGKGLTLAIRPCWNMVRRCEPSLVCHRRTCYCIHNVKIFVRVERSCFSFIIRSDGRSPSKILKDLGVRIWFPLRGIKLSGFRYYLLKNFLSFLCCWHYWCSFSLSYRTSLNHCSWICHWLTREKKSHHR